MEAQTLEVLSDYEKSIQKVNKSIKMDLIKELEKLQNVIFSNEEISELLNKSIASLELKIYYQRHK